MKKPLCASSFLAAILALAAFAPETGRAEVVRPAPNFVVTAGKTLQSWKGLPVILLIAPSPRSHAFRKQAQRIQASYQELAARNAVFVAAFTESDLAGTPAKLPSNVPFVVVPNGAQVAAQYGFDGQFSLNVIGRDGNLDLFSSQVVPASRIMDMILNNGEQQEAERKSASPAR